MRKVQRVSNLGSTKSSGFVYLVHKVAALAGCKGRTLASADRAILMLQRTTATLDGMNDELKKMSYSSSSPDLVASAIGLLTFVDESFGHDKMIRAGSIIKGYMNTLKSGFRRESEFRSRLATGETDLDLEDLLQIQEQRNEDLRVYFALYSLLVDFPSTLTKETLEKLTWFGVVDLTIDDFIDMEVDLRNRNFNLFLVVLLLAQRTKSYPDALKRRELIHRMKVSGVFPRVLGIADPALRDWRRLTIPSVMNRYLETITIERYNLLRTTLKKV